MDKKLFNYHYCNPFFNDFFNIVVEEDSYNHYSRAYIAYYRSNDDPDILVYDPESSAITPGDYNSLAQMFEKATPLSPQSLVEPDTINWWYERDYSAPVSLESFFIYLWGWLNRDRPIVWAISLTQLLYRQTEDYVQWLREQGEPQEYILPTLIRVVSPYLAIIAIPPIKDDRLYEMINELLGDESDATYQATFDEDDGQTTIHIAIEP